MLSLCSKVWAYAICQACNVVSRTFCNNISRIHLTMSYSVLMISEADLGGHVLQTRSFTLSWLGGSKLFWPLLLTGSLYQSWCKGIQCSCFALRSVSISNAILAISWLPLTFDTTGLPTITILPGNAYGGDLTAMQLLSAPQLASAKWRRKKSLVTLILMRMGNNICLFFWIGNLCKAKRNAIYCFQA